MTLMLKRENFSQKCTPLVWFDLNLNMLWIIASIIFNLNIIIRELKTDMKLCTTKKEELNRVHRCVVLCTCKIFKLLHDDMNVLLNVSFSFQINENIFLQRLLALLLKEYVYALTGWSWFGGGDRLSAEDALDKAKSTLEEIITIAQQVHILLKCYGLHLCVY